jgi:Flp pilus assembly protein TadG
MKLKPLLREWLLSVAERRTAIRHPDPKVVAFYWDGSAPTSHPIRDISSTGLYLITEEKWYPGTVVTLAIQDQDSVQQSASTPTFSVSVNAQVVRSEADGVGMEFIWDSPQGKKDVQQFVRKLSVAQGPDKSLHARLLPATGQSLVEFALILPLVFLLIVNLVNFGGFLFAWITVSNAARAGAQYAVLGGASAGLPSTPTATQITTLITNDISSLLNRSSLQVRVCTNKNGSISCSGTGTGTTPSDPEATNYSLVAVDVTYTYQALIPTFSFPGLNIFATMLSSNTIHRKAAMRSIE